MIKRLHTAKCLSPFSKATRCNTLQHIATHCKRSRYLYALTKNVFLSLPHSFHPLSFPHPTFPLSVCAVERHRRDHIHRPRHTHTHSHTHLIRPHRRHGNAKQLHFSRASRLFGWGRGGSRGCGSRRRGKCGNEYVVCNVEVARKIHRKIGSLL